jgi:hypothetical protein
MAEEVDEEDERDGVSAQAVHPVLAEAKVVLANARLLEQASCRSTLHRNRSGPPLCHLRPVMTFRDPDEEKA